MKACKQSPPLKEHISRISSRIFQFPEFKAIDQERGEFGKKLIGYSAVKMIPKDNKHAGEPNASQSAMNS